MDFAAIIDGVESFAAYVGELASVIGHVGRVAPLHDYCAGLLASEGRRSVEPMAALTAPAEVSVQHQRLLHFVGEADWSDARVLMKVRQLVVPVIEDGEPMWIIDDTSYPKQGRRHRTRYQDKLHVFSMLCKLRWVSARPSKRIASNLTT